MEGEERPVAIMATGWEPAGAPSPSELDVPNPRGVSENGSDRATAPPWLRRPCSLRIDVVDLGRVSLGVLFAKRTH